MISTDTSANVIHRAATPQQPADSALFGARVLALACVAVYLAASALVLAWSGHPGLAALHALVIAIAYWSRNEGNAAVRVVGDLLPLVVAPLLYSEVPLLIAAFGSAYHDGLVAGWEARLFDGQPSRTLAGRLPYRALSELLHAGYLVYYPVIFGPPLLLWIGGKRRALNHTVLALAVTCTTCWTIFVFFPVEGPRYLWPSPAGVPTGVFRSLATRILAAGSARGAAFPSSHMAVSTAQAVMAWRWQPRLALTLTLIALLIGVGAVYGGFHYAIDMIAGAALGLAVGTVVWIRAE